jgi:hypothetical protein
MSIIYDFERDQYMKICCDNCIKSASLETNSFNAAIASARKDGWKLTRIGVKMHVYCSNKCLKEDNAKRRIIR